MKDWTRISLYLVGSARSRLFATSPNADACQSFVVSKWVEQTLSAAFVDRTCLDSAAVGLASKLMAFSMVSRGPDQKLRNAYNQ